MTLKKPVTDRPTDVPANARFVLFEADELLAAVNALLKSNGLRVRRRGCYAKWGDQVWIWVERRRDDA